MAWWHIVLAVLGAVAVAFGVLVVVVEVESRAIVRHASVDYGQPFAAKPRRGAAVNDFWFVIENDNAGASWGVAKYRATIMRGSRSRSFRLSSRGTG